MQAFTDSTALIAKPSQLKYRFEEDGYVFLRGIVAPEKIAELRTQVVSCLSKAGWLDRQTDPLDAIPAIVPYVEGDEGYLETYNEVQKLQTFHELAHEPAIHSVMTALLGGKVFPHPLAVARLMFPDNDEWSTPPHQDYPNNQGTESLYACWIPLGDCPQQMGSLSILRGSHRFGVLPLDYALGAGHRQAVLPPEFDALEWVGGDFHSGDILIFHSLTVHRALHNQSGRMRLSVDYRYQAEGDRLTEPCLFPHFNRISWEEVYRDWSDKSLAYYWRDKSFEVVPWNPDMHNISPHKEMDAIKEGLRYDRKRERRRQDS
ncbi:MAG: phytanoyl-CoA dioxygenase family protein [Pseudomonadales bacterium]|nr:phytanoyl-CoA dioxygenase family protein [Pseudomonadales bacterium]